MNLYFINDIYADWVILENLSQYLKINANKVCSNKRNEINWLYNHDTIKVEKY